LKRRLTSSRVIDVQVPSVLLTSPPRPEKHMTEFSSTDELITQIVHCVGKLSEHHHLGITALLEFIQNP
jgi:hypothetical protein